jgi:uncharacterized membrane protein
MAQGQWFEAYKLRPWWQHTLVGGLLGWVLAPSLDRVFAVVMVIFTVAVIAILLLGLTDNSNDSSKEEIDDGP